MNDGKDECLAETEVEDAVLGLLPEERSGEVQKHLETCARCREAHERTSALLRNLRAGHESTGKFAVPEGLVEELVSRLRDLDTFTRASDPKKPATAAAPPPSVADERTPIAEPSDPPSQRLGNYELIELIGQGGMGSVYKARHRRMGRVVALKILSEAQSRDAEAISRFQREVHAAAKLIHPNIVTAFDADEAEGKHFLVMEYIDGIDLAALVRRDGPCTVEQAVRYTLDAARGLEFAHRHGIVHRDIKPSNLLLDGSGTVRILDMGLARLESHELPAVHADLTGTGMVMGTVDFMAPEQAISTRSADTRSDMYSLGVTLWHLLRGCPMYEGDSFVEKLMAHQIEPIPSLSKGRQDVPREIDRIFQRMVAKNPADRYQDMGELVAALEAHVRPRPQGAATRSTLSRHRKPPMTFVAGGVAGLGLLVALGMWAVFKEKGGTASVATSVAGDDESGMRGAAAEDENVGPQPPRASAPFDAAAARAHQETWAKHLGTNVETANSIGMRMTLIPPGEFLMGSTPEQVAWGRTGGLDDAPLPNEDYFARLAEEMPQHEVVIRRPFRMSSTEVTVAQFRAFVAASQYVTEAEKAGFGDGMTGERAKEADKGRDWKNPGYQTTDNAAVTQVTWNDAAAFCAWLSEREQLRPWYRPDGSGGFEIATDGGGYRLPTEAEWEYACRAGTTTQFSCGDDKARLDEHAWFQDGASGGARPVAAKLPNPFGLFDIHGNAYEWCQDWYDGTWYARATAVDPQGPSSGERRVVRGGSWADADLNCRSASRMHVGGPSSRSRSIGFRCVLSPVASSVIPGNTGTLPPVRARNYPQPAQWIDVTAEMRNMALRTDTGTVEGDGVQVVPKGFVFPLANQRPLRNAAVRIHFSRVVTIMARYGGSPSKGYLITVSPSTIAIDVEDHGQVGSGMNPAHVRRFRGIAHPTGFDIDAPHEFVVATQGDRITAWVDGREVVTGQDATSAEGPFSVVSWNPDQPAFLRKVEYAELPEPAAP